MSLSVVMNKSHLHGADFHTLNFTTLSVCFLSFATMLFTLILSVIQQRDLLKPLKGMCLGNYYAIFKIFIKKAKKTNRSSIILQLYLSVKNIEVAKAL
jgi:hypothetical protein